MRVGNFDFINTFIFCDTNKLFSEIVQIITAYLLPHKANPGRHLFLASAIS